MVLGIIKALEKRGMRPHNVISVQVNEGIPNTPQMNAQQDKIE